MEPSPGVAKCRWYAALLAAGALALLAAACFRAELWPVAASDALIRLAFVGLISVAGRFPLHVSAKTKTVVDNSLIFAALLLFPRPWGALVAGLGVLLGHLLFWRVCLDAAINVSVVVLEGLCVQWAYLALGGTIPARFDHASLVVPLVGAGLISLFLERLLVAAAVTLYEGKRFDRVFYNSWGGELKEDVALLLLGVLTALVVQVQPLALALAVIPIVLVYFSLRNGLRLRVLTVGAVESLADVIDRRDRYTAGHSLRVADLAERLAMEMGLPWPEVQTVRAAARVHDLGKIEIDASVLTKAGPLSKEGWELMRRHSVAGADIVAKFPEFAQGAEYVRYHHERWDGKGYPRGLRGEQIPLGARIIAAADAYDAMRSDRPYRKALSPEMAEAELKRGMGVQWDEGPVVALLRIVDGRSTAVSEAGVPAAASVD
jgi:HD-GYP domain-containing protein (c-di-GMP phosphodiesterase class II)